jgi:hypothetical protein
MEPIMNILGNVLLDAEMMDNMRKRAMMIRKYENEEEAGNEIITAINFVQEVYHSIGGIVNEIDKKHSAYTKISIDTIRYHMAADQTISGKLVEIIKKYAASSGSKQKKILRLMENAVCINRQEFSDGESLWHRNAKNRRLPLEPLAVSADSGLSEAEFGNMFKILRNDYSLSRIMDYMEKLFGNKSRITTREVGIENDAEFIMLLLAAIRAGERSTNFKAQLGNGNLKVNGYGIPEIIFTRKGSGN